MRNRTIQYIISSLLALFLLTCAGGKKLTNKNLAYIYYNDPTIIHPRYEVYHVNDSISELFFRLNSKEALYSKKPKDSLYSTELSVHYRLYKQGEDKHIIDSATIHLTDRKSKEKNRFLSGKTRFRAERDHIYYLEITLNDLIRDQAVQNYFLVNKQNQYSRQNFLIVGKNGKTAFKNYFPKGEEVTVKCSHRSKDGKIHGRYYKGNFELPAPPFSSDGPGTFDYAADSLFTLDQNEDFSFNVTMNRRGFYHFQLDTSGREGVTLFQFEGNFPVVKNVEDMMNPIRFLTTKQEYKRLVAKGRTKETVDGFWFSIAGNQERGRAIVKSFYNRVQEANEFFSSYVEGWKTDRGLIYTIYGPPNVIYKTLESENWIYGEQNNVLSVNFTFYKVQNPFTDNDFFLSRSPVYKSSWYRAVDSWRQGRVY